MWNNFRIACISFEGDCIIVKEFSFLNLLADFIGQERINKGWTQEQLAQKCSINRITLAKIETHESIPSLYTVLVLLDKLGFELQIRRKEVG